LIVAADCSSLGLGHTANATLFSFMRRLLLPEKNHSVIKVIVRRTREADWVGGGRNRKDARQPHRRRWVSHGFWKLERLCRAVARRLRSWLAVVRHDVVRGKAPTGSYPIAAAPLLRGSIASCPSRASHRQIVE
jgi:hypothetical protein